VRVAPLALLGALLAIPAFAEPDSFLPAETAERAAGLLPVGSHFRRFCAPCGDLAFSEDPVVLARAQIDQPGRAVLSLNGRWTAPSYVYVLDGTRWTSLARRLGLPDEEGFPAGLDKVPAKERLWDLAGFWVGTIGSLNVQLQLHPSDTRLEGSYFYERVGEPLVLAGTRLSFTGDGGADLTLREAPPVGEPTGTLQGHLDVASGSFTGVWTAAAGGRKLPFSLRRLAAYTEIEDHTELWTSASQYPVFTGPLSSGFAPLNAPLAERARTFQRQNADDLRDIERPGLVRDDYQPFTESLQLTVTYFRPELVSLRESMYGYTGGAHGGTGGSAMTYALRDGAPVQLTLADVLRPGAKIREDLVHAARGAATQQKALQFSPIAEALLREERFDSFLASPNSLSLVIPLGSSWGPCEVTLSRAEISGLLRPDGPLGYLIDPPRKPER
jgi:hypothetical protein